MMTAQYFNELSIINFSQSFIPINQLSSIYLNKLVVNHLFQPISCQSFISSNQLSIIYLNQSFVEHLFLIY